MMPFVTGALTGMGFGFVLYKVGATRYSRVMGMITLRDTKVMKFAFTAIGVAALLYGLAAALGVDEELHLVPRVMPYLGLAHVVGGVLFGAALGFSGLCPGTCVAKAGGGGGNKKLAGPAAIAGLFAGVIAYDLVKGSLVDTGVIASHQQPLTLHGVLGLPYAAVALAFGALLLLIALAVDRFTPERVSVLERERRSALDYLRGEWSWVAAGTAAAVLVVLATAQNGYLGFSGAVLALTGWLAHAFGAPLDVVPAMSDEIVWRAALIIGVLPGGLFAKVTSLRTREQAAHPLPSELDVKALGKTFAAASSMTLGAMIGGGCTTGAFIAAWPTLSLGSFAMAGTFFAVSMGVGSARLWLVRSLDLPMAQSIGDRVYD